MFVNFSDQVSNEMKYLQVNLYTTILEPNNHCDELITTKNDFCTFLGPNNHPDIISSTKCHVCQLLGPTNQRDKIFSSKLIYAHFWDQITIQIQFRGQNL